MEINGLHDVYQLYNTGASGRAAQKAGESAQAGKTSSAMDTVNISPRAAFQGKLDGEVKKYAAAAQKDMNVSSERLAALKVSYQGDNCPVSGMDVARAILNKVCGANAAEGIQG